MVVSKCEQEKERQLNRSMEMDDHIKEDLAKKVERRQKALAERINLAKKQLVKVKQASDARSSSRESLMKHIDKDMSDKENNRRSFIQGIKDHCHMQLCRVDSPNVTTVASANLYRRPLHTKRSVSSAPQPRCLSFLVFGALVDSWMLKAAACVLPLYPP
ncbi:unnamed protein product [Dicrocoelium dendriticum]|nr:unnamed protein product [Dicrocoelium dendriticum]